MWQVLYLILDPCVDGKCTVSLRIFSSLDSNVASVEDFILMYQYLRNWSNFLRFKRSTLLIKAFFGDMPTAEKVVCCRKWLGQCGHKCKIPVWYECMLMYISSQKLSSWLFYCPLIVRRYLASHKITSHGKYDTREGIPTTCNRCKPFLLGI